MIIHLRFRAMRAYSLIFRCRNSVLMNSCPFSECVACRRTRRASKGHGGLQSRQCLTRFVGLWESGLLAQFQSVFNFATCGSLFAFRGECGAEVVVKRGGWCAVVTTRGGLINVDRLLQLLSCYAVQTLFVVN